MGAKSASIGRIAVEFLQRLELAAHAFVALGGVRLVVVAQQVKRLGATRRLAVIDFIDRRARRELLELLTDADAAARLVVRGVGERARLLELGVACVLGNNHGRHEEKRSGDEALHSQWGVLFGVCSGFFRDLFGILSGILLWGFFRSPIEESVF